jgi:hypothetical protein
MATKPIDYDALDRQARSPSHQLRMNNMLGAIDPAPPASQGFLDYLSDAAHQVGNTLSNGLTSIQDATQRAIRSSPTLTKVKNFFGDFGNALSNGIQQSPKVPQAFDEAKKLPQTLRDAQQSIQR